MTTKQPETFQSLGDFVDDIIEHLTGTYIRLYPKRPVTEFAEYIFGPISRWPNPDGERIEYGFAKAIEEENANGKNAAIYVSCTYCMQAINAEHIESAWRYAALANYWSGVAAASIGVGIARLETIVAAKKDHARMGGFAKAAKTIKPLQDEAFRLVRERIPPSGMWKSANAAALALEHELVAYAKFNRLPLMPTNAARKIAEWFRRMPDASELFATASTER